MSPVSPRPDLLEKFDEEDDFHSAGDGSAGRGNAGASGPRGSRLHDRAGRQGGQRRRGRADGHVVRRRDHGTGLRAARCRVWPGQHGADVLRFSCAVQLAAAFGSGAARVYAGRRSARPTDIPLRSGGGAPGRQRHRGHQLQPEFEAAAVQVWKAHGSAGVEPFVTAYSNSCLEKVDVVYGELVDYLMFKYLYSYSSVAPATLPQLGPIAVPAPPGG